MRIWDDQLGHEVVLLVGLADLVRLLAELHGHALVLDGEVALVGVEALGGGDGAQREVDADGLLGRALHALDEAVGVLAGDRQPLLDVDALRLQLAHGALDAALQVALHERLGRLDLGEPGQRLGDPTDELLAGLVELRLGEALGDRRPPGVDGLELAEVLGDELVGRARAGRAPARRVTVTTKSAGSSVPFGRRGERQLVAGEAPIELVVEVVGDPALADLVGPVLGVQPGDVLAVAGGVEVERDAGRRGRPGGRRR